MSRRVVLGVVLGILLLTVACSGGHGARSASHVTPSTVSAATTSSTSPACPGPPVTQPASDDDRRTAAARVALAWTSRVKHWAPGAGHVAAVYKVGATHPGQFGDVFAYSVPKFCGQAVAGASWCVELSDPAVDDTGRQAAVVVAHFASGWQVWGAYA